MRTNYVKRGLLLPLLAIMFLFSAGLANAQQDSTNDQIWFTNPYRSFTITLGEEFAYQYEAATNLEGNIRFELDFNSPQGTQYQIPEGIEIDAESGILTWTPEEEGAYFFRVKAYMENDSSIYTYCNNYIYIERPWTPPCATININLTAPETLDTSYYYFNIFALPVGEELGSSNIYFANKANPSSANIYTIQVPAGEYNVYLDVNGNAQQNDLIAIGANNPYTIVCDDILNIEQTITYDDLPDLVLFNDIPQSPIYDLNDTISFVVEAVSTKNNPINYTLITGPEGATLDPVTGQFTWIPTSAGYQQLIVKAYTTNDSSVFNHLQWYIYVRENEVPSQERCAVFMGYITDEQGEAIRNASVYAIRTDSTGINYETDYMFRDNTSGNGFYVMAVPAGTYTLVVEANNYVMEYFDNTSDYFAATQYTVDCYDTLTLNAELAAYELPNIYTVSGRITDETTGEGLSGVVEFFYAVTDSTNGGINFPNYCKWFETSTDESGYYSIQIPEDYTFVARAYSTREYFPEYFNNTMIQDEAELVTLTGDRNDINFGLTPWTNPTPLNGFGGSVSNPEGTALRAMVTAIRIPGENENVDYAFFNAPSDSEGNYYFENLPVGNYILFAMAFNGRVLPGFYVMGDTATWNWQSATVIALNDIVLTVQHDIILPNIEGVPGPGRIRGKINKHHSGGLVFGQDGTICSEDVVDGAIISIFNKNNVPVSYFESDSKGEFDIKNIAFGDYKVVASKVGYTSSQSTLKITKDTFELNETLYMEALNDNLDVNDLSELNSIKVYPNPAQAIANIAFNGTDGNVLITISDVQGNEILKLESATITGINTVNFNVNQFSNGVYLVKVTGNGANYQTLLNVVK